MITFAYKILVALNEYKTPIWVNMVRILYTR